MYNSYLYTSIPLYPILFDDYADTDYHGKQEFLSTVAVPDEITEDSVLLVV